LAGLLNYGFDEDDENEDDSFTSNSTKRLILDGSSSTRSGQGALALASVDDPLSRFLNALHHEGLLDVDAADRNVQGEHIHITYGGQREITSLVELKNLSCKIEVAMDSLWPPANVSTRKQSRLQQLFL
jgi:hypothetical protein